MNKIEDLINIVRRLRKECPWDKEQTFDSIKAQTLEETYEVIEAIDNKDFDDLRKELGDMLLHVVFYSVMAEENKLFVFEDIVEAINSKLISRHPHVFGDKELDTKDKVLHNWEKTKMSEGRDSLLDGVPRALPGLQRAERLQDKAAKAGFDWEKKEDVWAKVLEEIEEMQEMEKIEDIEGIEKEIGDVFFALINYCRFLKINPENALRKTNDKFILRFQYIEKKLKENGKTIFDSSLVEMDKYWNESKQYYE